MGWSGIQWHGERVVVIGRSAGRRSAICQVSCVCFGQAVCSGSLRGGELMPGMSLRSELTLPSISFQLMQGPSVLTVHRTLRNPLFNADHVRIHLLNKLALIWPKGCFGHLKRIYLTRIIIILGTKCVLISARWWEHKRAWPLVCVCVGVGVGVSVGVRGCLGLKMCVGVRCARECVCVCVYVYAYVCMCA